jgi:hypothetical protein
MKHNGFSLRSLAALALAALALVGAAPARAAGTTPLALAVQFDLSANPMPGCLLYFYQSGTVATPQQVFTDFGLTQAAPNPLQCDAGARVPQHWLADGLTHIRLTDASGVVVIDTTMQVLGPSSGGGGGGGGGVDPTAVFSTGDIKARLSAEILTGWVLLNGTTIGSASSGATQRANADTQNLFVYLWQNCPNAHCPVAGGRGVSGISDFSANKTIALPDMRSKSFVGRDCMGASCAGLLLASNISSGGTDTVDTPGAGGGQSNQTASITLGAGNIPTNMSLAVNVSTDVTVSGANHAHGALVGNSYMMLGGTAGGFSGGGNGFSTGATTANSGKLTMSGSGQTGSGSATCNNCFGTTATSSGFGIMGPFLLSTFYMKL